MYVSETYDFYGYYDVRFGWSVQACSACPYGSRRYREVHDRQQPLFIIHDDGFLYFD